MDWGKTNIFRKNFNLFDIFIWLLHADGALGLLHLLWTAFPGTSGSQSDRDNAGNELRRPRSYRRIYVQGRNQRLSGETIVFFFLYKKPENGTNSDYVVPLFFHDETRRIVYKKHMTKHRYIK